MREIEFRGKRRDNWKWVYGDLVHDAFVSTTMEYKIVAVDDSFNGYVKAETVGQYTGLADCKGTKIFEGDIVRAFSNINKISDPHLTTCEPEYKNMMVIYRESGFCLRTKEGLHTGYLNNYAGAMIKDLEVIGNIHDNGELLEVEK